jgi:hypothetical protein
MLVINDVRFAGKYVAVDANDKIIGYSENRDELIKSLEQKGYKMHEYSILYIPFPIKIRIEYSKIYDLKIPLMNLKVTCKDKSFRVIASFGNRNLLDKSFAELCGIEKEDKILIEIGGIKKEIDVRVSDLAKMDLPIVPGLVLEPSVFNFTCFYKDFFEIGE